jgi:hypothetical protein
VDVKGKLHQISVIFNQEAFIFYSPGTACRDEALGEGGCHAILVSKDRSQCQYEKGGQK